MTQDNPAPTRRVAPVYIAGAVLVGSIAGFAAFLFMRQPPEPGVEPAASPAEEERRGANLGSEAFTPSPSRVSPSPAALSGLSLIGGGGLNAESSSRSASGEPSAGVSARPLPDSFAEEQRRVNAEVRDFLAGAKRAAGAAASGPEKERPEAAAGGGEADPQSRRERPNTLDGEGAPALSSGNGGGGSAAEETGGPPPSDSPVAILFGKFTPPERQSLLTRLEGGQGIRSACKSSGLSKKCADAERDCKQVAGCKRWLIAHVPLEPEPTGGGAAPSTPESAPAPAPKDDPVPLAAGTSAPPASAVTPTPQPSKPPTPTPTPQPSKPPTPTPTPAPFPDFEMPPSPGGFPRR